MADRPTRSRPARSKDDDPATGGGQQKTETAAKASNGRKKASTTTTHDLFYEDENGALNPLGSYAGHKPENVLEAYLGAIEDADRSNAIEASLYAVDTAKGLVRLTINQTITIARR